jgi:EmrB/QacA subfamily drug resistance transporter
MTRAIPQPTQAAGERVLTPEILALAAVVVLGAIMTILDATIVNVALPTLGRELHTPIATLQWVTTAYLLAFASVIPLTGWASQRFGAKPLWLASLGLFMTGSLLAGLSWSIGALIAFRIVQGLGGGMIMPLGQTILAQAAGPQRMGRVMSIVGVPMLLAPIAGPVIGGVLVGAASWRWIFFVNLPVGAFAFALALRLLPPSQRQPGAGRLDALGLALLSGGIAIFIYGLAEVGRTAGTSPALPVGLLAAGAALVTLFVVHALRTERPLLDVRLFTGRGFGTAAAVNLVLGTALFGVALLLPLYFQIVRDQSPFHTGLLLVPQGLGAAVAISIAGALTDKFGARRVVPIGVLLALAGTGAYTQITASTGYWYLATALFLVGAGLGATITPSMAAAFHDLDHAQLPSATSAINVVQRIAASLGTALLAVVLQRALASEIPILHGGIGQAAALAHNAPETAPAIANAFATTFWVAFALTAAALIPALLLPSRKETT